MHKQYILSDNEYQVSGFKGKEILWYTHAPPRLLLNKWSILIKS